MKATACWSYLVGVHDGLFRPEDLYRVALYGRDVILDASTPGYSPAGEIRGGTYPQGGFPLNGRVVSLQDGVGCLDFAGLRFPVATVRGAFQGLVYNDSLPGKNAVCVLDFGMEISATNGPFEITLPEPGADTSLVRFGGLDAS